MYKIIFVLSMLFFTTVVNSQSLSIPSPGSNQERLEDMEDELRRMRRNQLLDDMKRDQQNQNNSSVDYISIQGFKKIYEHKEFSFYIQDRTIDKTDFGIWFTFLYSFNKPRYVENVTYFYGEGFGRIECKKSMIRVSHIIGLNKEFKGVVKFEGDSWNTTNEPQKTIKSYLCR